MATARPPFAMLSIAANLERHKLSSGEPFALLLKLQYPGPIDPTATQQYLYLARYDEAITFDALDGQGPQVYEPFNFELGDLNISSSGEVPQMTVKCSNIMGILQTIIEGYGGLAGAAISLFAVNTANPAGEPDLALSFTVKQAVCDNKLVTFTLGAPNPLRRLFPLHVYRPNFCGWSYKSAQCGYVDPPAFTGATTSGSANITGVGSVTGYATGMPVAGAGIPSGATILTVSNAAGGTLTLSANATATASGVALSITFTTCTHTIDGVSGCQAHFPNQPLRGLFFPGIDTNGAAVASVA